ncbi:MAG: hypothetical protein ACPG80_00790 [Rickettsiales bacterium]
MSSKNNPLNRNRENQDKMFDGKKVKPVLFIAENSRYMAAQFEDGKMVLDPNTQNPVPFQSL